jgi:hypothetical protein
MLDNDYNQALNISVVEEVKELVEQLNKLKEKLKNYNNFNSQKLSKLITIITKFENSLLKEELKNLLLEEELKNLLLEEELKNLLEDSLLENSLLENSKNILDNFINISNSNEEYAQLLKQVNDGIMHLFIAIMTHIIIHYINMLKLKTDEIPSAGGGFRKKNNLKPTVIQSKEILGKIRRIYKVAGSRKEHIKYKGELISVSDYKNLVKKAKALKSQNKPVAKPAPKPKAKPATKPKAKPTSKPKAKPTAKPASKSTTKTTI